MKIKRIKIPATFEKVSERKGFPMGLWSNKTGKGIDALSIGAMIMVSVSLGSFFDYWKHYLS